MVESSDAAASNAPPSHLAARRVPDLVLGAMLAVGVLAGLYLITSFGYGRDQGIYAVVGRKILDGGMPYRDAWDFKPPGIFLVYALARGLFGGGQWGIRALEVLGLAAMVAGMIRLSTRWWGQWRIGLLGGMLAVLVHAQLDFWHTAQPESFGGMLIVGGLVAGTEPPGRLGTRAWQVLAGVLFGCAGLLKWPLAGAGVIFALAVGLGSPPPTSVADLPAPSLAAQVRSVVGRLWPPALAVAVGGALPFAACLAWFAAKGALRDAWDVLFVFTPHYTAIGWEGSSVFGMCYYAVAEWLVSYSAPMLVGLVLLLVAGPLQWRRPGVALLAGVVAIQLLGVAMQGKFFPYHYGAAWPATGMLAALGWWWLWERACARRLVGIASFVALALSVGRMRAATKDVADSFWSRSGARFAMLAGGPRDDALRDSLASVADVDAGANRAVAAMLHERVAADRSVYVWGFEPVMYDQSERRSASRYVYNVPQRVAWAAEPTRAQLMRELAADPPAAIVVAHNDVFPMVTGDLLDSAGSLAQFWALRQLLDERYELAQRIQDFDVYLERD